jgi:hypothetical protein
MVSVVRVGLDNKPKPISCSADKLTAIGFVYAMILTVFVRDMLQVLFFFISS